MPAIVTLYNIEVDLQTDQVVWASCLPIASDHFDDKDPAEGQKEKSDNFKLVKQESFEFRHKSTRYWEGDIKKSVDAFRI